MFPDSRMPTEQERQKLCELLFYALLEMRGLGNEGKAKQVAALANAFHNLPVYLWSSDFSFAVFRELLEEYQESYSDGFNYLQMLDEILKDKT